MGGGYMSLIITVRKRWENEKNCSMGTEKKEKCESGTLFNFALTFFLLFLFLFLFFMFNLLLVLYGCLRGGVECLCVLVPRGVWSIWEAKVRYLRHQFEKC